jgi:hypothetical protein
LNPLQYITEPFAGYDIGLGHTPVLVKGFETKTTSAVAEFNAAIGVRVHTAPLAAQLERLGAARWR